MLLVLLIAFAGSSLGQTPSQEKSAGAPVYEGLPIARIVFEPEIQPIPAAELDSLLPFQPGDLVRLLQVRVAIERLMATGRYREILVDADRGPEGIVLRFLTTGSWFVGRITVQGVDEPPNRGQLISATKLQLGAAFREEDMRLATESLQSRLSGNGYFEARVNPSIQYDPGTQQVSLDFRVDSGPRAKFTTPLVKGVPEADVGRITRASRWKRWSGLLGWKGVTETRVQRGLERIRRHYVGRDYLQSRVTLESLEPLTPRAQARPILAIDLGPKTRVRSTGAKLSTGRLRQLVPIFQEQSADRDLIVEGLRNVANYFRTRGYFRASVEFETTNESDGSRTILYHIDRGERYKLVDLDIRGNTYFRESDILERMSVTPATFFRYRQGRFSEPMLEADVAAIRDLYVSNGFRNVSVSTEVLDNFGGAANRLGVVVRISEGPQSTVADLTLTGPSPEHAEEVQGLLSAQPGQPFSEIGLATDRDTILSYYYNRGYPNARVDWEVTPAAEEHQVNLAFRVEEGQRQFVRGILVGGLEISDPEMVSARIRLAGGDALSQAQMVESQRRLYDLGVFARVDMAVQNPDGGEAGKYLLYQFEEARKYSLSFGFGAEIARIGGGTPNFDAPAGEPGFSPRVSVSLSRSNFLGTGHTVGVQGRISNIQQRAGLTYLAPQFKGRENFTLTFSAIYDVARDIRTFESRRQEGSVQASQRLSLSNTLQTRFAYRRNTVHNLAIDPDQIPIFNRAVRVGILSTTFIRDRRDDPIDSHRGSYNSVDVGYASKAFTSETDYFRLLARNSTYHRVWGDLVLARSTTMAMLNNFREGGSVGIPLPERYFSGGASTHRGFPDNQAGPRDLRTGFPLGGTGILMNNFELRFPVLGDNFGGVVFHDAGNVYSNFRRISLRAIQRDARDFNYMVHAAGFGLRYRTPVGPVRIDLAYVPNSPFFEFERAAGTGLERVRQRISRFQFHFSLGQTF